MSAIDEMNAIVASAIEDMLGVTDDDELATRTQLANDELDEVMITTDEEEAHLTACKDRIAQALFDIGSGQRKASLRLLVDTSQNITAASQLMDEAAADNILTKVAAAGNTVAETVKSVAATVEALGTELKKVGNKTSQLDGEALSEKINATLDKLKSLKNL